MPPSSKKAKRKGKSKQNAKKVSASSHNVTMQTKLYDEEGEYPSSRVIKRAPNGDVIVESLPVDHGKKQSNADTIKNMKGEQTPMAFTLDSHWESLTPEEKKCILRIEKDEVFDVIRNYQNNHGCNCSVCGRRHMAMDQEMERIYNTLYDLDKERDPEINPVKFHLSIIKELQNSKIQQQQAVEPQQQPSDIAASNETSSIEQNVQNDAKNEFENMRDEVVKYFLSSTAADNLKEEVMHFKQSKKQQQIEPDRKEKSEEDHLNRDPTLMTSLTDDISTCAEIENSDDLLPVVNEPVVSSINDGEVQAKYLKFAKTFVSSHPKIAEEYVNRMMMYPDMRALTDDLMNNNGQGFVKAIENFVMQKQQESPQPLNGQAEADISRFQHLSDAKDFTTMLHNGKPLTPEEYENLQRHVADRMTNSYDTQKKEFKEVSQLERELFTRFMFGEDRKNFGDLIMQSFREKFDDQDGNAAISASLAAAAAATTVSPIVLPGHDDSFDDYGYDDEDNDDEDDEDDEEALENNEYDETYDDYSEYDNEEDLEDEGQNDINSEYEEEEDNELPLQPDELNHHCSHPEYDDQYHKYHNHEKNNQNSASINDYPDHHYHHRHGHEDEFDEEDEDYDSSLDEADRLEEGRKLIQIAITKLLQGRIMESYHEKEAENNKLKLLQELEAEEQKKKAKEEKKQKKREKEKEKKKAQQLAKEEGKRKREEEAEMLKKEAEEREKERREVQRKKVEESKRKKDEEKRRKLEEQRRREEEQEHQRKLKEEMKRKRDEEKRLREEERMQREDEKRKKDALRQIEELNKKKEEQRIFMEKNKAEEQEQLLKRQKEEDLLNRQNKEQAAIQNAQIAHFQYLSSSSNNMAFGSARQALSNQHNAGDVSDDILSIISSAAVSKPLSSSPAKLPAQMNAGNGLQHKMGNNQSMLSNTTPLFGTPNFLGPKNFSRENPSLDNLSCMRHPASSSQNSTSPGLAAQSFGMPSWNSFANGSANGLEHSPQELQQQQQVPTVPSFVLSNTEPNNEKYYAEEINNLSNMLSSAGLQDATATTAGTFGQPSLWDVQRSSISVPISGNTGSATNTASGFPGILAVSSGTPKMATATEAALINNGNQHSSIWDNANGSTLSLKPGEISSIANDSSPNYANSSIWGTSTPSSMSFLDTASNIASTIATQNNNDITPSNKNNNSNNDNYSHSHYNNNHVNGNRNADDDNDQNDDAIFIESIYKTYLIYAAAQGPIVENQYVLASLLHHNSLCRNFDYSRFVDLLLRMRNTHGCQLVTNASGSITHVRLLGAQQNIIGNTSTTSRDPISNELYHSHAGDMQHVATSLQSTDGSPSIAGTSFGPRTHLNSQLFHTGQNMNPSSLAGNIWG